MASFENLATTANRQDLDLPGPYGNCPRTGPNAGYLGGH